ncbi:MAG: pyridoxamine 5'-phosphate oxidase [Bacteroidales bacterium]|nr:pyridoxamine 5'-phosphate oxidase [Bacteroidales bacterium]MBN2817472.1 pyridoxamine 5'-phosphate oxidase [Bacteroidales bacterium]
MKEHYHPRREYNAKELNFNELLPYPMEQFAKWFKIATEIETHEPNAMALATTSNGEVSVRYVLLKAHDSDGLIFFSNYESRKSAQIRANPKGAAVFYWPILQQQVRVEGDIIILNQEESDEYFNIRPQGSKIGTWASPQSKPIPSREYLENLRKEYEKKYSNFRVPRPEFWGGYKLIPSLIEFWQGRPDRLHDRFEYRLKDGLWKKERLAP